MRKFINIVESVLTEIERGGELGDEEQWDKVQQTDFEPRQLDMFGDAEKDYEPQGHFDGYDVATKNPALNDSDENMYVLFRGSTPVAYASLAMFRESDNDYQVKVIRIAPSEQGKGLAPRFYRWLLTDGHINRLYADEI